MEEISTQRLSATSASVPPLLQQELAQAQEVAQNRQQAVLFRWHIPLVASDPWAVCCQRRGDKEPFFVWQEPDQGFCLAAWGQLVWDVLPCVDDTWALLEQRHRTLTAVCWNASETSSTPQDAPFVLTTLAFSSVSAKSGVWQNWQAGVVFVPRVLLYTSSSATPQTVGGTHAVLATWIHPDDALTTLTQRILDDRMALQASMTASSAAMACLSADIPVRTCTPEAGWEAQIAQAHQDIDRGLIGKVVLARKAAVPAPTGKLFDAWASACTLRTQHPSAIVYAVGAPNGDCFMGATPEILLRTQHTSVQTHAVAGTIPIGKTPEETATLGQQLLQSAKDRHEHQIVVAALREALTTWCSKLECPETPKLLPMRRLQHLFTPLHGTLRKPENILHLVRQVHPTPATGGWPKQAAKSWLTKHERLDRGLYAGPIGWMTQAEDGRFAVALRSMLLTPKMTYTFAGAGIVRDSIAAAEWEETQLKLTAAQHALVVQPQTADR